MGRKSGSHTNRRSRAPESDREKRVSPQSVRRQTFGMRRPVHVQDEDVLFKTFSPLVKRSNLLGDLQRNSRLHVTLLELSALNYEVARGLATGYEMRRTLVEVEHNTRASADRPILAALGRAAIYKETIIVMEVLSDELRTEERRIIESLVRTGFRDKFGRRDRTPHITLGRVESPLHHRERQHVIAAINSVMPIGDEVQLDPVEYYPNASTQFQSDVG